MKVNLHTHTRWSDGYLSFQELVNHAKREGLEYLAITDHDRTKGWSTQNVEENSPYISGGITPFDHGMLSTEGLKLIQGVELSANDNGTEVHILGLFINQPDREFQIYLDYIEKIRWCRAGRIAERLRIETSDLIKVVGEGLPCRLHFGYIIFLKKKEEDPSLTCARDAMDRYVSPRTKNYVSFEVDGVYTPQAAIGTILAYGGIPVWAHPERTTALPLEETFRRYSDYAQGKPIAIEVTDPKRLDEMMNKFTLVTTGNDFHGYPYEPRDKPLAIEVPAELMQRLIEAYKAMTR